MRLSSHSYGMSLPMWDHSYLPPDTSERAPPEPQPVSRYSIYLPRSDGRLSWPRRMLILMQKQPVQCSWQDLDVVPWSESNFSYLHVKLVDILADRSDWTVREAKLIVEVGVSDRLRGSSHDELLIIGTLVILTIVLGSDTAHNKLLVRIYYLIKCTY